MYGQGRPLLSFVTASTLAILFITQIHAASCTCTESAGDQAVLYQKNARYMGVLERPGKNIDSRVVIRDPRECQDIQGSNVFRRMEVGGCIEDST